MGMTDEQAVQVMTGADAGLDHELFAPPVDPSGYTFDSIASMTNPFTAEQATQFQAVRSALHAHGVPAALAAQADRMIAQGLRDAPDATTLELMRREGMARLTKTYGAEVPAILAAAREQFAALAAQVPGLADAIERSGVGSSPWLIVSLANLRRVRR